MAIIKRAKRDKNYCVLPNTFLQDSTISFECRGLIAYLLSHTEDWVCRSGDLEREGKIGRDARRTIMKEAEKAGYLTFHTERLKNGQFNTWYDAHEEPVSIEERTTSWETGKSKPATGFTFSPGTGKPRSAESYDGQAVPILSTEVRSTELRIGDIDIPQTPSLVENPKANFPLANGDAQSVHAQQSESAPIDLSKIVEDGFTKCGLNKLFHIGETKPSTVHANGDSVTPPDTPAPPVTEKPQTDHQRMMAALDRVSGGRKILNGAAQGKAIKKILTGYTADQAIECLEWMADPQSWWNGNADWLSVQSQILSYFRRKEQQSQTKLGGNYGQFSKSSDETGRSKLQELCNRRALGDFG